MNHNHRHLANIPESGQSAVLFMLALIGLIAFVGLSVDGGNALNERRVTQNAADASALRGVHYMASSNGPQEQQLLEVVNSIVEANGIPDTDGTGGNATNDNVTVYYTDERGNRQTTQPCYILPCGYGSVPQWVNGLEVEVDNRFDTYFIGVIGQNTLNVGANAVAVVRGFGVGGLGDNTMVALGDDCDKEDRPLAGRAHNSEFLGGLQANSWFQNSGENNHYHGQIYYDDGFDRDNVPSNEFYEPGEPTEGGEVADPFAGLVYTDFAPGTPVANSLPAGHYHDVSVLDDPANGGDGDGTVEMREITNQTLYPELYNPDDKKDLTARDGVVLKPNQLRQGLYYAGDKAIWLGESAGGGQEATGTNGNVTIVSGNRIKLTEKNMNLNAYLSDGTILPGLLFFSGYQAPELADPCDFDTSVDPIINMAGNSGTKEPEVYHHPGDLPKNADPDDYVDCPYPRVDGCYVSSSNLFVGLIYAPNGRVATSGGSTTYIGAIVSWTIDINGNENLFVHNSDLFPSDDPMIFLDK